MWLRIDSTSAINMAHITKLWVEDSADDMVAIGYEPLAVLRVRFVTGSDLVVAIFADESFALKMLNDIMAALLAGERAYDMRAPEEIINLNDAVAAAGQALAGEVTS